MGLVGYLRETERLLRIWKLGSEKMCTRET